MPDQREIYAVQITRPHGITVADMKGYIEEALMYWGRGGDRRFWDVADFPVRVLNRQPFPTKTGKRQRRVK